MNLPQIRFDGPLRFVVPGLIGLLAAGVGMYYGLAPSVMLFAAGAVLLAIWLLWQSLQSLTGEAPLSLNEALGMGAPTPEEERKRAVLRALKDLEYERGVGKISEEDYQVLSARYRREAKALLKALDTELSPLRTKVERNAERLMAEVAPPKRRKKGKTPTKSAPKASSAVSDAPSDEPVAKDSVTPVASSDEPVDDPIIDQPEDEPVDDPPAEDNDLDAPAHDDVGEDEDGDEAEAQLPPKSLPTQRSVDAPSAPRSKKPERVCDECETSNDGDARFCKRCGTRLIEELDE